MSEPAAPGDPAPPTVFLFGAGGHAKVVIDVLRRAGTRVVACLEPDAAAGALVDGVPVLDERTGVERLRAEGHRHAFVAIGDNRLRLRIAARARADGLELVRAISPLAMIAPDVVVSSGTLVVHGAIVNAASRLGDDVIVNTGATVDHDAVVGDGVHIAPGCHLAGNVTVGSSAMIGIGTVVIPGVTIGSDVVLGAGSVVVRDVPDGTRAWGNPARGRAQRGEASHHEH